MNTAAVQVIADAVLYEGYLLYPYRPSVKNRQRWTFGGLWPPAYTQARGETEPCTMRTECLIAGDSSAELEVQVRFLHLRLRRSEPVAPPLMSVPDPSGTDMNGGPTEVWQEAVERTVAVDPTPLVELAAWPRQQRFAFPASHGCEADGLVREQQPVAGIVEISAEAIGAGRFRVAANIRNETPLEDAGNKSSRKKRGRDPSNRGRVPFFFDRSKARDEALLRSLLSTHTVLGVQGGQFVSLIDPPQDWRAAAAGCRNVGTWPVLVGVEGDHDTMLSSPIILYDYPRVAPESPGNLFDGTEIDEILSLRILTLTDEEKRAACATDDRARALLERTEALAREQLLGLHGTFREVRP